MLLKYKMYLLLAQYNSIKGAPNVLFIIGIGAYNFHRLKKSM